MQSDPLHSKIKYIPNACWTIPITALMAMRSMWLDFQWDDSPPPIHRLESTSSSNKGKWSSIIRVLRFALGTKPHNIYQRKKTPALILNVLWGGSLPMLVTSKIDLFPPPHRPVSLCPSYLGLLLGSLSLCSWQLHCSPAPRHVWGLQMRKDVPVCRCSNSWRSLEI